MSVDRELLKEVTKELWSTVKKLRPELDKQTRLQLVLKGLITIGDLPDHVEAAMVVGICAEMEGIDSDGPNESCLHLRIISQLILIHLLGVKQLEEVLLNNKF